jgi:hypothetical protein
MADGNLGECRCGSVRFAVNGPPLITMACHCAGCQRMTASAYSLSSLYPSAAFRVTEGEPVVGGLRGATRHFFCPDCMSWLFTRPEGLPDFVNVRSTMLADVEAHRPFIETYTSERLPWAQAGAAHGFEAFPPEERFPELLAAYADWRVQAAG